MKKPPYAVASMAAIRRSKRNGLSVASTFSGTGGSCLGFRMAGFETVFASEFVEAARDSYRANFPGVPLDPRDVRELTGADLLAAAGRESVDVLEGSPPCASFSVSGRRDKFWGQTKRYSDTAQRSDDLFDEFIRLLSEVRPRAFVAENVKGLVTGKAKGYYLRIVESIRAVGYSLDARVLDAQWLGVPQRRERVFLVGFAEPADAERFVWPSPLPYRYSVADALPGLRARTVKGTLPDGEPIPTVQTHGNRKTFSELTVVGVRYAERDASKGIGEYAIGREWDTLRQGEGSKKYSNLVRARETEPSPTVTAAGGTIGTASVAHPTERRKFTIAELRLLCGFPADFVLTGTYAQQWERLGRAVPPPMAAAVAREVARALGV